MLSIWFCPCAARTTRGWQCPTGREHRCHTAALLGRSHRPLPQPQAINLAGEEQLQGRDGERRGEPQGGEGREACSGKGDLEKVSLRFWQKKPYLEKFRFLGKLLEACLTKMGMWGVSTGRLDFNKSAGAGGNADCQQPRIITVNTCWRLAMGQTHSELIIGINSLVSPKHLEVSSS